MFSMNTYQPPRRLEGFAAMKYTTEAELQKSRIIKFNYIVIDENKYPSQFICKKDKFHHIY